VNEAKIRSEPSAENRRLAAVRAIAIACLISLSLAIPAVTGFAHIVMGTKSLHLRVVEADLIVRGRVVDPEVVFISDDEKSRRRLIEVDILEELKGRAGSKKIRFAQDGHEVARYAKDQEALFFLVPIERSRELRALAVPGGPSHVSGQEHDEEFLVTTKSGPILLSATRDFAASESAEEGAERVKLIRRATLALLTSRDTRLSSSALSSLVLSPNAELVTSQDMPHLESVLSDTSVSVGYRAGLIAELERRNLIQGSTHWVALLENAALSDLPAAIRVAGAHPSPAMNSALIDLLASPESSTEIKAECAVALGSTRNAPAVPALTSALASSEPRLRNAAIRGLGQIGGPEARRALEDAAEAHPDPATRRLANARLRSSDIRDARTRSN